MKISMNKVNLSITVPDVMEFHIVLHERLTIVTGDSGLGKTSVVRDIFSGNQKKNVVSDIEYVEASDYNYSVIFRGMHNNLLICDDTLFSSKSEFKKFYESDMTNWFLVFARDFKILNLRGLPFSVNSWKRFYRKSDRNYAVEDLYSFSFDDLVRFRNYSKPLILTEDTKAGNDFFSAIYKGCDVQPFRIESDDNTATTGKDIIYDSIRRVKFRDISVLICFIDMACFGDYIQELSYFVRNKHKQNNVVLQFRYQSFEYFLLNTNVFKDVDFNYDKSEYLTLEKYCEDMILKKSYDTVYEHSHGRKLSRCWYEDCNKCGKYIYKGCDDAVIRKDTEKLLFLVDGTPFNYLYDLKHFIEWKSNFVEDLNLHG